MVRQASETESKAWSALPPPVKWASAGSLLPSSWAYSSQSSHPSHHSHGVTPSQGPELLDRFLSPPLLLGALFFQWRIAGIIAPVAIQIADYVFMFKHAMYWQFAFLQMIICVAVNWGENEIWRRLAGVGVVAGLWAVGWAATPDRYKKEAWEHLKWIWTWMAFDEARMVVRGGRRRW